MSKIKNYIDNNPGVFNNEPDDFDFEMEMQFSMQLRKHEEEMDANEAILSQHDFVGSEMSLDRAKQIFESVCEPEMELA